MYQCLVGAMNVAPAVVERAGRRSGEIATELTRAWVSFLEATEGADDHLDASAEFVGALRRCAAEFREFIGDLDFYDDAVLSPILDMPRQNSTSGSQ